MYMTSFLVLLADLSYATDSQMWFSPEVMAAIFLAVWLGFLALAAWRNNLVVVLCMSMTLYLYHFALRMEQPPVAAIVLATPILAFVMTWFVPGDNGQMRTAVRATAGVLLAWMAFTTWAPVEIAMNAVALVPLIGAVLLAAGELFFPVPEADNRSERKLLNAVIVPAVILASCAFLTHSWGLWFVPAAAVLSCVLVAVTRRNELNVLTGWLVVTPFTFFPLLFESSTPEPHLSVSPSVVVVMFIATFVAALAVARFFPVHHAGVAGTWTAVLFAVISPLVSLTAGAYTWMELSVLDLLQAVALVGLLVFAAFQTRLWRAMQPVAQSFFAGAGLFYAMVAWVTLTTTVGELIAPRPPRSDGSRHVYNPDALHGADFGFLLGHMTVSITWMAIAAWLLLRRTDPARSKPMRTAGLVLASVATFKLVLFDMASLSGIPRVLTFTVCGLLLIAVAVIGAQRNSREVQAAPSAH